MNETAHKAVVKVQVRDAQTDELLEEKILTNDYIVVCSGHAYPVDAHKH